MGGSSTPTQAPTQTSTTSLSPQAQQLFNTALPALTQYASSVPQRYQGETVAPFTPNQTSGMEGYIDAARRYADVAGGAGAESNTYLRNTANTLQGYPSTLAWDVPNIQEYQRTPYVAGAPQNYRDFQAKDIALNSNIFNDPGIWNPEFNTGLRESIMAAQRPLYQQLTEQTLPAIRGSAVTAGGFGGSRQGIAEGLASGRTSEAAADVARRMATDVYGANLGAVNQRYGTNVGAENQRYATNVAGDQAMYATNINAENQRYGIDVTGENARYATDVAAENARYATNRNLEQNRYNTNNDLTLRAMGMIPGTVAPMAANTTMGAQAAMLAPQAQMQIGGMQQAQNQLGTNAAVAGYNYDQLAPYLQAKDIMSLAMGFPGATTTNTGSVPQPNMTTSTLGGAMTGASLGSMFGPIGTGVGAIGGAALPWLTA